MKTYNYRIIGTSIMCETEFTTIKAVKQHIIGFFGECKIEYWGKTSGIANVK